MSTSISQAQDTAQGLRDLADTAQNTPLIGAALTGQKVSIAAEDADQFVTLTLLLDATLDTTDSHLLAERRFGPLVVEVHIDSDTLDLAGYDRIVAGREALNDAIDAVEDTHDLGAGLGHWSGFDTRAEYAGER